MKLSCLRKKSFFADNFEKVVENLQQEDQKNYLYIRYLRILRKIENNSKRSTFWYFTLSTIVTIGSIVVPALISIQDEELQKKSILANVEYICVSYHVKCNNKII